MGNFTPWRIFGPKTNLSLLKLEEKVKKLELELQVCYLSLLNNIVGGSFDCHFC